MGNCFVADQLPFFDAAIKIIMIDREITEFIIAYGGVARHRLVLHPNPHCIRNRTGDKQKILIPQRVVGLSKDVERYKE